MTLDLLAYGAFFLTMALTYSIMCLGLNVQWGQTGLFNVGVAGFVGIGAYTSAYLTVNMGFSPWITVFAGLAITAYVGR